MQHIYCRSLLTACTYVSQVNISVAIIPMSQVRPCTNVRHLHRHQVKCGLLDDMICFLGCGTLLERKAERFHVVVSEFCSVPQGLILY